MNFRTSGLALALTGVMAASGVQAVTIIDNYQDPNPATLYTSPNSGIDPLSTGNSDFATDRFWSITHSGTGPGTVELIIGTDTASGVGQASINSGTGLLATATFGYDSADPAGINLAAMEAPTYTGPYFESFVITLTNIDFDGADFTIDVSDASGTLWSATQNITLLGIISGGSTLPYDIVFPFSSFTDGFGNSATAADFSQVTSVSLTVAAAEAVDMVITDFNAYGTEYVAPTVPEPGPLALLGLGLAGLGLARRRKQA